jgi:hypothetical protein
MNMIIKELLALRESFGALEKLSAADLKHFHMDVPAEGPPLMAAYKGGERDTILALGVDPAEGKIRVAIENPSNGSKHVKYFADDAEGYQKAKAYANELRSKKVNISQ